LSSESLQSLQQVRKFIEHSGTAKPQLVIDSRIATDNSTRRHVIWDTGLRRRDSPITNFAVSGNTHLSGQDHIVANFGGTRKPDLSAEKRSLSNLRAVSNLHEVVHLRTAPDFC
jgi:hypothetical protein